MKTAMMSGRLTGDNRNLCLHESYTRKITDKNKNNKNYDFYV